MHYSKVGAAGFEPTTPTTPKWITVGLQSDLQELLRITDPVLIQFLGHIVPSTALVAP
ncbi:MAG: hypothetical protein NZ660_00895 [Oscillatoriaceae bacterium SKYG93]|nr:hypothetical protein [Oscillatoriaceae bacterium SKYG93]MDW8451995.1 hypothetical protein [Oscillatoriaceae cyanobacterium SKYGB_i_bin93]